MLMQEAPVDAESDFFTNLEEQSLLGGFVVSVDLPDHTLYLARVNFRFLPEDIDRRGRRRAELATFTTESKNDGLGKRTVSRRELCRDWIVLPDYCRDAAEYFCKRAETVVAVPDGSSGNRMGWFRRQRVDSRSDWLEESGHRETLQLYLASVLASRVRQLQLDLEWAEECVRRYGDRLLSWA